LVATFRFNLETHFRGIWPSVRNGPERAGRLSFPAARLERRHNEPGLCRQQRHLFAFFTIKVAGQVTARSFHPFHYWAVIVATTTLGTTMRISWTALSGSAMSEDR
jgi:hypothetical protein